tara:strand:- start:455 stop:670 length:216 start_codon:yes stop_codon:yes gene_type:complete
MTFDIVEWTYCMYAMVSGFPLLALAELSFSYEEHLPEALRERLELFLVLPIFFWMGIVLYTLTIFLTNLTY